MIGTRFPVASALTSTGYHFYMCVQHILLLFTIFPLQTAVSAFDSSNGARSETLRANDVTSDSMYILQDVPGKGKGLVASEDIAEGTRILSEKPVITTPERQYSDEWLKEHISRQVGALNAHDRQSLLSLHNIYPFQEDYEQFLGIFRTNGLPIEANGTAGGVFLEACRINHSCDNNAQKHWNQRIKRHTVHALRKIPKGEEITINYLGLDSSRGVRRGKLQNKFGFLCTCRLCFLPTTESQENDQRWKKIDQLDDLVGQRCMAMDFSIQTLRYVDERVQLYNEQGPGNSGLPRAYLDAAQIAIANGDLARGRVFAEKAVEGWRIAYGSDSDEVIEYTALAKDPSKLPLYGISMKWKTSLDEAPMLCDSNDFEGWLWRRPLPKLDQLGQLTNLRNRDIFPEFTALPYSSKMSPGLFQGSEGMYQPSRHWCFLGEITDSTTIHHLELKLTDVDDKTMPLHFNTASRGTEVASARVRNGYTVAVLDARRRAFIYGDPGIDHVDFRMLKVRKTHSHAGSPCGVTNVIENRADLPSIIT
jgi:hypothetical protein